MRPSIGWRRRRNGHDDGRAAETGGKTDMILAEFDPKKRTFGSKVTPLIALSGVLMNHLPTVDTNIGGPYCGKELATLCQNLSQQSVNVSLLKRKKGLLTHTAPAIHHRFLSV